MSGTSVVDNTHVAFLMAIRRLELQYGVFIHTSSQWTFLSKGRPCINTSIFSILHSPEYSAALEREVDAEPRPQVLLS